MTTPDFSEIVWFTDIHHGLRNNSRDHNNNCEEFIKWMIAEAKVKGIKTCIFGGDYHHVRSAINISTLNYSVNGLRLISQAFDHVFFILGNHDLYFRDKLDVHSIPYISEFPNIQLINDITCIGDFAFVPWLVGDKWKRAAELKNPYIFGHFELPTFQMNAAVVMPDHGQLNKDHFAAQRFVFSGHFHKRQNQNTIWYTGNCFPHNYADVWDDERGLMFWKPGSNPEFKTWPNAPKYRTLTLSQVITNPTAFIDERTYARITIDVDASYEDINWIKELLETQLHAREVSILSSPVSMLSLDPNAVINFESVDDIVLGHLSTIDSNTVSSKRLIEIYNTI